MLFDLLINFCILFTFAVLSYWPFQDYTRSTFPFSKTHPYIIGIMAGFAGYMLMESSSHVANTIIIDARYVLVVIVGIFGGPIAPIVAGIIMGISRMFILDTSITTNFLAGLDTIVIGIVVGIFCFKYPMTFKNVHRYFYYATIQTTLVFSYLIFQTTTNYLHIVYFVLFASFSFFIVMFILMELNVHFKKIRRTELLSETDYLTGLYNNWKFQQLTHSYITDSTDAFSMISIDIDHFREVNDVYGHPAGDEILKGLAERLLNLLSSIECYVTRAGGEQFVVLLPNSPPAIGLDLGERIRSGVAQSPFEVSGDQEVSITVSVGVSSYPDNGMTIQELYSAADKAMYESKAIGRNRVSHYNNQKA